MNPGRCGALLLAAVISVSACTKPAQTALPPPPPLPRVALDAFPSSARDSVLRAYQHAEARPEDADAAGALARLLHAWEQWDTAHEAYARAQALAPQTFQWRYLDGVVLQRLARHAEAAAQLKQAVAARPDYRPARVKLADALFDAGALEESRPLFDALARDPESEPMGRFGRGRIAAADGRHQQAIEDLERVVALAPDWGAAHYALALSYRAVGRRDDAQRALEHQAQFAARWPVVDDPELAAVTNTRDDARALLERGQQLSERGDLAGAVTAYEAALARDPSLSRAHLSLISLYGRQRNWARAEEHYRAAVGLGVDLAEAHYEYGVLLGMQDRLEQAAEAYRKAIDANPGDSRARNNLGEIFERQRQFEPALLAYRQAVARDPLFRLARLNTGRMLIALGRPNEAIVELEKLREPRDVETPLYLFALAAAHIRAGHKQEGIKWGTEARKLALQYGLSDLAADIERDLARVK